MHVHIHTAENSEWKPSPLSHCNYIDCDKLCFWCKRLVKYIESTITPPMHTHTIFFFFVHSYALQRTVRNVENKNKNDHEK